jgi:hypothetical protein
MIKQLLSALLLSCTVPAGAQWTTVCNTGDGMVVSLTPHDGSIYAAGFFNTIGGVAVHYVSRWDGTAWHVVDNSLPDAGHNIRVIDTNLYLAQYRQVPDSNWVKKWNGTAFEKVGDGVYLTGAVAGGDMVPNIYDVVRYRDKIIACGEFDIVGDKHISRIMQWNGTQWDSLGSGLSGSMAGGSGSLYPHQLLTVDTDLYVVGAFVQAGGVTVNGVARWDGSQWHAMGAGFNSFVYGIALYNGILYAGGEFTASGSTQLLRIAKWDGTAWVNPGFGIHYTDYPAEHPYVHTLGQIGSRMVFEGGFDRVIVGPDTFVANNVIALNGSAVDTLAGGVPHANFEGLMPYDSGFIVGGATWPTSGPGVTNLSKYGFSTAGIAIHSTPAAHISPNPFTDKIVVEDAEIGSTVRIMSATGQLITSEKITSKKDLITLPEIAPGLYILQYTEKNGSTYTRMIKQ